MKMHNVWGYGQLFGYSGLDGQNFCINDFVGTLTAKKIGIRFELREWVKVTIPVKGRVKFHAVTGDMIDAQTKDGEVFITFSNAETIVGVAPFKPIITTEKKWKYVNRTGGEMYYNQTDAVALVTKQLDNGMVRFAVSHSTHAFSLARAGAKEGMLVDINLLKKARYEYFKNLPKCKDRRYEKLYYKALSVNKVNVHSPEGDIPCLWTTPDRIPHRRMWLWDSVFHSFAFATYNHEMAKNCLRSILSKQRADGFVPAMMNPRGRTEMTQPQVISWGAWVVYQKCKDKSFLEEVVGKLEAYLTWDMKNRDINGNGLLEWFTEPEYLENKSGESGQDNSPRFDVDERADAMDFSAFQANDAFYLAKIYAELGNNAKAEEWNKVYENIKNQINKLLWNEQDGVYYDRLIGSGKFTNILTPSCFIPMMVGIPSQEQADRMVKKLTDPNLLWTNFPLATVSKQHPLYSSDFWRGGVWLNMNYMIMKGLRRYGYNQYADELKQKTLDAVNKWYKKTGSIFEFYDPEDKLSPFECDRLGKPVSPPDWRKHPHSVCDFNWSACFTLLLIQDENF